MSTKKVLKISGMTCPNCAMILESVEDDLKGVIRAEASYRKAQLIVEYDSSLLSEETIKQEIKRLGYEAV
ncbi:MAG: heavy-metal-associated domain-containing protein [Anaerolineaceae bacterium]